MEVKQRIIQASIELMSRGGIKSTTMDDIAHHIGISKRTIYENFKDKTEIVIAVTNQFIKEDGIQVAEIQDSQQNIIKELFIMIQQMNLNFAQRNKIAQDIKKYYPELFAKQFVSHYNKSLEGLAEGLQRGIEQGYILKQTDLNFVAYIIIESISSLLQNPEKLTAKTLMPPLEAIKGMLICFFRGIATTKGIGIIDEQIKEYKL